MHVSHRGQSDEDIIEQLKDEDVVKEAIEAFMAKIEQLGRTVMHQNSVNSFAVSPLMITPSHCWYPDDGDYPKPNYVNYMPVIEGINKSIADYNKAIGMEMTPKLQYTGRRSIRKGTKTTFIFNRFRETKHSEKFHFIDSV